MLAPQGVAAIVLRFAINDFHRSPGARILGRRAIVVLLLAAHGVGGDAGVEAAVAAA